MKESTIPTHTRRSWGYEPDPAYLVFEGNDSEPIVFSDRQAAVDAAKLCSAESGRMVRVERDDGGARWRYHGGSLFDYAVIDSRRRTR